MSFPHPAITAMYERRDGVICDVCRVPHEAIRFYGRAMLACPQVPADRPWTAYDFRFIERWLGKPVVIA